MEFKTAMPGNLLVLIADSDEADRKRMADTLMLLEGYRVLQGRA